jgi:hypothetical protein
MSWLVPFSDLTNDQLRAVEASPDLGIPLPAVTTYDGWCAEYFDNYIGGRRPWNSAKRTLDFEEIRARVRADILAKRAICYEFVVVDEGQDLDGDVFEVLRPVARHVTVAADRKQQLYDYGASEEEIAHRLGLARRNVSLLGAFRCSPYIVPLGAAFITDPADPDCRRPARDASAVRSHRFQGGTSPTGRSRTRARGDG